jgi:parallel beta-helix repeat protein
MSRSISAVVGALVLLHVLFPNFSPPPPAGAAEVILVDAANEGAGVQDGRTWQTAWSTITKAANDPRWFGNPGSALLIRPGVYREQIDLDGRRSGIPGAINVIRAEAPGVVVDGEKIRNECFLVDGQAAYIQIDGIVCRNARHRGFLLKQAVSNFILSNNVVFNSNDSGIELSEGSSNNAIVNNRVYTSGAHGITLRGAGASNSVVNNLVYDHAEDGIQVIATSGSTSIRNNTVYGNRHGIYVDSPAIITNNIAAANSGVGLFDLGGPGTVNDYNCIQGSGDGDYQGANGLGPHSVRTDPLFVNPQGDDGVLGGDHGADDDFHLQSVAGSFHGGAWTADLSHSPCIDAGDPSSDFSREPDSNGGRINIGADGNTPEASLSWAGQSDSLPPSGAVSIKDNAAYTNSLSVSLSLLATDVSGVSEMCISNDLACTSWQPYAPSRAWTLTPGDGGKTVYVRFKDRLGNADAVPFTDQIVVDTVAPTNPTVIASASHSIRVWSPNRAVRMTWAGAGDNGSGVSGYSARWDTAPASLPVASSNVTETAVTSPALKDGTTQYFHLRTRDRANNWSPGAIHYGPFFIDGTPPVNGTLTAAPGAAQVLLTWSGFTDTMSGLDPTNPYKLVVSVGPLPAPYCTSGTEVFVGAGQSFLHKGLTRGTTYQYRLCAVDRTGNVSTGATRGAKAQ